MIWGLRNVEDRAQRGSPIWQPARGLRACQHRGSCQAGAISVHGRTLAWEQLQAAAAPGYREAPNPEVQTLSPEVCLRLGEGAGVALASASEATFNWTGFLSAMGSNVTFQSRNVFSKKVMSKNKVGQVPDALRAALEQGWAAR